MKTIIMMTAVAFLSSVDHVPQLFKDLEEGGVVKGSFECSWKKRQYQCVVVQLNQDIYNLVGEPHTNGLVMKYILKLEGKTVKEIWRHTDVYV